MNTYSIIIQGPLAPETAHMLRKYHDRYCIVVSNWNDESVDDSIKQMACAVVSSASIHDEIPVPPKPLRQCGKAYNNSNVYAQATTSLRGCEHVCAKHGSSTHILKMRSDEVVNDVQMLFGILDESPDRIVTSNVTFRPDIFCAYHADDHIIAARREWQIDAWKRVIEYCRGSAVALRSVSPKLHPIYRGTWPDVERDDDVVAEVIITQCFLHAKDAVFDRSSDSAAVMREHYAIVSMEELGMRVKQKTVQCQLPRISSLCEL